jgi:hypothetical protein
MMALAQPLIGAVEATTRCVCVVVKQLCGLNWREHTDYLRFGCSMPFTLILVSLKPLLHQRIVIAKPKGSNSSRGITDL